MTKDEALRLALEALTDALNKPMWNRVQMEAAITAIKQVRALDKKAENARELGLDYEPVAWMREWDDGERIPLLYKRDDRNTDKPKSVRPLVYGDTPPSALVQEKPLFADIIAQHPGLTEELKAMDAAPVQEIDWKDMYEKEKRRSEMWVAKYEKDIGPLEYAAPVAAPVQEPVGLVIEGVLVKSALPEKYTGHLYTTPPAQRTWVDLTDEECVDLWKATETDSRMVLIDAIKAKIKDKNTP
jgi:hypothetical protein